MTQVEEEREFKKWSLQELSDSIRKGNIRVVGIPDKKKEKGTESLLKAVTNEKFPNLWKELDPSRIQEANTSSKQKDLLQDALY